MVIAIEAYCTKCSLCAIFSQM